MSKLHRKLEVARKRDENMIDYEKQFEKGEYEVQAAENYMLAKTFRIVYGWMTFALALSGAAAWYAYSSGLSERLIKNGGMTGCLIGELALVFVLSLALRKMPVFLAFLMFIAYAALNGLTMSVIFMVYKLESVQRVVFITAAMFGGLAVYGSVTKDNLNDIGKYCGMALWGLIIASIVNIFFKSSGLDWIVTFVGILIFTGLTMYDAQKVRAIAAQERSLDNETVAKLGLLGALELYLDFINLFLYILRLLGKRK